MSQHPYQSQPQQYPSQGADPNQYAGSQQYTGSQQYADPNQDATGQQYADPSQQAYQAQGYSTQAYSQAGAAPYQTRRRPDGEPGFFRALFDLKFEHFITVKFAAVLFIIAIVVAAVQWLSLIASGIATGFAFGEMSYSDSDFSPVPVLLAIFLGWIPSVLFVLVARIVLEFIVSGVRTAQNTTKLAHAADQG